MVTRADRPLLPPAPLTIEDTGLSFDRVEQLVLKTLHFAGELSASALGLRLGLVHSVLEPVLQHLKREQLCDFWGGGTMGGPSFIYRLTDAGRVRSMMALEQSRYVGAAPVPFAQYERYMRRLRCAAPPRPSTAPACARRSHTSC